MLLGLVVDRRAEGKESASVPAVSVLELPERRREGVSFVSVAVPFDVVDDLFRRLSFAGNVLAGTDCE